MVGWQSGTVAVTDGHLAWHRAGGDGPALVLSHGLTDNGLCWSRFAAAMAADFDVIMLDARGHGASSRMSPGDPPDPGQDLREAIDALGLTAPIVMGHSVGARATAAFVAANPGRASRIVLEDPPLLLPFDDATETMSRQERLRQHVATFGMLSASEIEAQGRVQSPGWHPDEFPAWVQSKHQVDPAALPVFANSWQHDFAALDRPTLLICGEHARGSMVSPACAAEAEALNHHIRTVRIAGAGHNVRRENFTAYVGAVRAFLIGDGG
jgi:N-formylmaleamate deformylase